MTDPALSPWIKEDLALEVWKYYGSIGGADKDRMITMVTWLLGISGGIVGFYATGELKDRFPTLLLLAVGGVVSLLAALVALMYGGYALWNWTIADRIAATYNWPAQIPSYDPIPRAKAHWTARFPLWLAAPYQKKIAPVFWIFFGASLISLAVQITLMIRAWK